MIKDRLFQLRQLMKEHHIDIYMIPTSDYHQSEYVGDYFKCRQFMSGFTGSAGTLIVSLDEAKLWTDGRYFIQAKQQLQDSSIELMKMGVAGVDTIEQYLNKHQDATLGFDGKVMAYQQVKSLPHKKITDLDLVGEIWHDRPELSHQPIYIYDEKYCGQSRKDKLTQIRKAMKEATCHVLTSLDDIAWVFNIRGNDVTCNPVCNSYALIFKDHAQLYLQDGVASDEIIERLKQDNISISSYHDIYQDMKDIHGPVLLDSRVVNYQLVSQLQSETIIDDINPSQMMKAIKNNVEIEATKHAHLKDGVAMTKFMYWLKHTVGHQALDELTISNQLEAFRKQQDDCLDLSFDTICAYQANGALMHYKATKENSAPVDSQGLLLIDSGGQYIDGTTDVTRTFVLGEITENQKRDFTVVLKAMLRLQNAHFIHGTTGSNLDILARGIIYQYDLDYRCGTGHGVGHLLNVHEGPNSIRPKDAANLSKVNTAIVPGMITTDEPGIYHEGLYGIRHENELLCVPVTTNEYGAFYRFEAITYVPFDIDGIEASLLSNEEIQQFNAYQKDVYQKLAPYLSTEEKDWLQQNLFI